MRTTGDSWARRSGVLLGLIAAAVFLLAFPVKGGGGALGLDVTIASNPTGVLEVETGAGPFLRGAGLAPNDDPARGTLHIRNQSAETLDIGINVMPSTNYSDEILQVTATYDGRVVMQGTLGELRGMRPGLFSLDSGKEADVEVTAEVVDGADGYQGRVEDVMFELRTEVR